MFSTTTCLFLLLNCLFLTLLFWDSVFLLVAYDICRICYDKLKFIMELSNVYTSHTKGWYYLFYWFNAVLAPITVEFLTTCLCSQLPRSLLTWSILHSLIPLGSWGWHFGGTKSYSIQKRNFSEHNAFILKCYIILHHYTG